MVGGHERDIHRDIFFRFLGGQNFLKVCIDKVIKNSIKAAIKAECLEYKVNDRLTIKYGEILVEFITMCLVMYLVYLLYSIGVQFWGWK